MKFGLDNLLTDVVVLSLSRQPARARRLEPQIRQNIRLRERLLGRERATGAV
jgi:hypothetical protein